MELAMSIINIILFLISYFIVLRIYFSVQRTERQVHLNAKRWDEEAVQRMQHIEMMRVEMEALNRTKRELDARVEECAQRTEELKKEG